MMSRLSGESTSNPRPTFTKKNPEICPNAETQATRVSTLKPSSAEYGEFAASRSQKNPIFLHSCDTKTTEQAETGARRILSIFQVRAARAKSTRARRIRGQPSRYPPRLTHVHVSAVEQTQATPRHGTRLPETKGSQKTVSRFPSANGAG